jgi:ergothioneine biosynthesis protein EgtB
VRAVHAGCLAGQMASGPHDMVLRAIRAGGALAGLRAVRSGFRLPVQQLLRHRRRPATAPNPRTDHAPGARGITDYRRYVDAAVIRLLEQREAEIADLIAIGLSHEQQHQELLITDMMHAFAQSPLAPAVLPGWREPELAPPRHETIDIAGGIVTVGHAGDDFAFDNESPRHEVLLRPFRLANRLVRNREWLAFIADGGYRNPMLWMADGWAAAQVEGWTAPLYWRETDGAWRQFGPGGLAPLAPDSPVRHVSWYEADAYARWAGARLPTEFEMEAAATRAGLHEWDSYAWQWTASAYGAYPGFRQPEGAIGEYNGKFMINQMVLRGGSLATSPGHLRDTYRNFFHPDKRWQFTGLRLAWDA